MSIGGVHLEGTASVASYLAPVSLKGSDPLEKAQVIQWLYVAEQELLPAVVPLTMKNPPVRARQELETQLDSLNTLLLTRTYLVGETVTLADVAVACALLPAYQLVLDEPARLKTKNVLRWFKTITCQPNVKYVVGDVHYFGKKL